MITDDERREVAENLRHEADYPGHPVQYMEQFIGDLRTIIFSDALCDSDYSEIFSRLADLVEPAPERVCRMIDNGCELCCSECDARHGYDDEPSYCHNCGARVVEVDDGDR